jgi:hypothetical protein
MMKANLAYVLIAAGSTVILGLFSWVTVELTKYLQSARFFAEHRTAQAILVRAVTAARVAVSSVFQAWVGDIKAAGGTLTDDEKKQAKEDAIAEWHRQMGTTGVELVKDVLGVSDLTSWASGLVEAAVHEVKLAGSSTPAPAPAANASPPPAKEAAVPPLA